MKPIEPGCRAMIVGRPYIPAGTIVTVLEYLGSNVPDPSGAVPFKGNRWRIDATVLVYNSVTLEPRGFYIDHVEEDHLRRIGDDEELSSWEEIEKITNWNPTKVANHH